jgi:hypothetical protein
MDLRVNPSVPRSPPGAHPVQRLSEDGTPRDLCMIPRPNYRQVQALRRPSEIWLNSPAWIGENFTLFCSSIYLSFLNLDGASNPPIFFYSNDEILATLEKFRPDHPRLLARSAGTMATVEPSRALSSTSSCAPSVVSSSSNSAPPSTPAPRSTSDGVVTEPCMLV